MNRFFFERAEDRKAKSGSKPFDIILVFLEHLFEKVVFSLKKESADNKKHAESPSKQQYFD